MKLSENAKLILGLNTYGLIGNLSVIPFAIGFLTSNLVIVVIMFGIAFIMQAIVLALYIREKKFKADKKVIVADKLITVLSIVAIWLLMVVRVLYLVFVGE